MHLTFLRLTPLLLSDKTQHVCPLGQLSSQTDGTRAWRPARRPPQSWLRDTELPPSAASPCVKATPFCGLRVSKLSSTLSARITFPRPAMVQPPCPANDPALGQSQEPPGGALSWSPRRCCFRWLVHLPHDRSAGVPAPRSAAPHAPRHLGLLPSCPNAAECRFRRACLVARHRVPGSRSSGVLWAMPLHEP